MVKNEGVAPRSQWTHSRFNRIIAIVLWGFCLLAVSTTATAEGGPVWVYPVSALTSYFAWIALWRPGIEVGDDGVLIRNVTHTVRIPWGALIHVDTRHALTLHTPGKRFAVWSAPAPGMLTAAAVSRRESNRERRAAGGELRPGDLLGTDSGDAAMLVREEWQRRLDREEITVGEAADTLVRRRWSTATNAAALVLLASAIAFFSLVGR